MKHWPIDQNGNEDIWRPNQGINLLDNVLNMRYGECVYLQEMLYKKNTPIKRYPFTQYSTQDLTTDAPFKGSHEYIDSDDNSRLLFGTDSGKIIEYINTTTSAERVTGLGTGRDYNFSSIIGRVLVANGDDYPQVGEGTTWRRFGALPPITNLAVTASGSGSFSGDWLHIVVPVKEITSDVAEIYGDWSNIITTTASANAQFDLTWTDIVDSRCTMYWVFRTNQDVPGPFYRVARVSPGTQAYTDTTTDANLEGIISPILNAWGQAPKAKYCEYSGNRVALANLTELSGYKNAVRISQLAANKYDLEAFPTNGNLIYTPGKGSITGIKSIGETGENSRTNHLFIGQKTSCYILPETDPKQPLIEISAEVGLSNQKAIAQWGSYIFWHDVKKGLVFWQVGQKTPWKIGDKIDPIFFGGGSQQLLGNQGDVNIKLTVWEDNLLITVRDSTTVMGPNKCYLMDLNAFTPESEGLAKQTARFVGPWTGPGFSDMIALSNRTLVLFDNQNEEILFYDSDSTQDYIGGTLTNIKPRLLTGSLLATNFKARKRCAYIYVYHFSNSPLAGSILGEFGRIETSVDIPPIPYDFTWDDIDWLDLDWNFNAWQSEGPVDLTCISKWFQIELTKDDIDQNYAFFGLAFNYEAYKNLVTYY